MVSKVNGTNPQQETVKIFAITEVRTFHLPMVIIGGKAVAVKSQTAVFT